MRNFKLVRTWFEAFERNTELYTYLDGDFKANTILKEECRKYVNSRMHELLPLVFKCPESGAKHEMPWPESFLFEVVLNRKHEWKKNRNKNAGGEGKQAYMS